MTGCGQLVLTRKKNEIVSIENGRIEVELLEIRGDKVRLAFRADPSIRIHRKEVQDRINTGEPLEVNDGLPNVVPSPAKAEAEIRRLREWIARARAQSQPVELPAGPAVLVPGWFMLGYYDSEGRRDDLLVKDGAHLDAADKSKRTIKKVGA